MYRGASSLNVTTVYYPDSYDRCLLAEVAPEVIEPGQAHPSLRRLLFCAMTVPCLPLASFAEAWHVHDRRP